MSRRPGIPTAVVAALTLVIGFAVADVTDIRALGGVVLVLGCGWCAWRWWTVRSPLVAVLLTLVFLAAFVLSHPLGHAVGAWPSVALVALVVAAITFAVADRDGSREPHEVG